MIRVVCFHKSFLAPETPDFSRGGGVLHYNAPEGKWLSRLRFAGAIQTLRDVT
jgi:hypothetical protein